MDVVSWLQSSADQIPDWLRWLASAAFAALEVLGLGPFVPGEVAVLLLGATFDTVAPAVVLVLAVTIGASAGDHVLYALGRRFGPGIRDRRLVARLGVARWDAAVGIVERRGPVAIVATRLVPIVRTLTPVAAGTARVPQHRFTVASLIGSLTWALVWGGSGFLLKSSIGAAERALGNVTWVVAGSVALVALVVGLFRVVRRRRRAVATGRRPATAVPRDHRAARVRIGGRSRRPGPTAVAWTTLVLGLAASTGALLTAGGPALPDGLARALGSAAATVVAVAAVAVGHAAGRRTDRSGAALAVGRWAVTTCALLVALSVHGIGASLGLLVVVLLGVVEVAGRRSRLATVVHVLAGIGAGLESWPYAWTGGFAAVGSLASLSVFATLVLGTVAAIRSWRDRLTGRIAA